MRGLEVCHNVARYDLFKFILVLKMKNISRGDSRDVE